MPFKCPSVDSCCGCITDLKAASAIIAVLALVTNPVLSWLMIRHSYAMRVSCFLTAASRVDVVDVNINNIISFGFGVNAGLGASCLTNETPEKDAQHGGSLTTKVVKGFGWVVLTADVIFLITSMVFLITIFKNPKLRVVKAFMRTAFLAVLLTTIYGILYVVLCVIRGKGIALCELILSLFDLMLWMYFLVVIRSYARKELPSHQSQKHDHGGTMRTMILTIPSASHSSTANSTREPENASASPRPTRGFMNALRDCCNWIANLLRISGFHGIGMSITPSCDIYLTKEADEGVLSLNTSRWILFVMSIIYIGANIFFVFGVVLWLKTVVESFIIVTFLWAIAAFVLACEEIILIFNGIVSSGSTCLNISDVIAIVIYVICNIYFTVVISSYVEEKQDT